MIKKENQMSKLSIQEWIKTINLRYIYAANIETFSNDVASYNKLIQSMQGPSDFKNLNNYIEYCKDVQKQLHKQKVDGHIKLAKAFNQILDEFQLLSKTQSEQLLARYINYLNEQ